MTEHQRVQGNSPYEATIGFSRAVRVGDQVFVSGTGPVERDGSSTTGGVFEQAERCFTIIIDAITDLGGSRHDVLRTRMYLTDPAHANDVGRSHAHWFADVCPAATMIVVAGFLRPEWRVEIEAEAVLGTME